MKRKYIISFIKMISEVLIYLAIFITLFVVVSSKRSGEQPQILGYRFMTVLSGSMEPQIKTGSLIAIDVSKEPENFKEDDVITFVTEDKILVTHRIIDIVEEGETYATKGDANNVPDTDLVQAKNIVGIYTDFKIPYLGYVLAFANTRKGLSLFFIIPGLILIVHSFVLIIKAYANK